MLRMLRFAGLVVVHTIVAIIDTPIAEGAIAKMVSASHSLYLVVWNDIVFSVFCAASMGFCVSRVWRSSISSARWIWVVPAISFTFGLLVHRGDVFGGVLIPFKRSVLEVPDVRSYYAFSAPLIRSVCYSVGAYASARVAIPSDN